MKKYRFLLIFVGFVLFGLIDRKGLSFTDWLFWVDIITDVIGALCFMVFGRLDNE